ncbi:hypothetical protein G7Y89_g13539 [Cudoniella acicularis]|uniref:diphosphoinositol-polyphosphate diphosphatase n=1 Tax=Cudoniella acicularis TaxID=354080 RepID=A0A8H4VVZ0_9HELO|nr:hypothetical protein G7Y89_g13539 [Cudoniella acicularis]
MRRLGGRIVASSPPPTLPEPPTFFSALTPSHGLMAPTRHRKNLVCFYCNKKSGLQYDGLITQWECTSCGSMNFLDADGEITDPPVASNYKEHLERPYAINRAGPDPDFQRNDATLFCSTCLKNQHLYMSSLSQYYVETDPSHPEYRKMEKEYFKYKDYLEKLYPQVCEDCQPRVLGRMRQAQRTAQSDHMRRLLEKTRMRRMAMRVKTPSLCDIGRLLWWMGLLGQLIWNAMALLNAAHHEQFTILNFPIPPIIFTLINPLVTIATSERVLANPLNAAFIGAHGFAFVFYILLAVVSHRCLKIDMTPLWASTPEKLPYVGLGSRSCSPSESMGAALDEIKAGSGTPSRLTPSPTPTPMETYNNPSNSFKPHSSGLYDNSSNSFNPPTTGGYNSTPAPYSSYAKRFPVRRTTPSLLDMEGPELTHYFATGEAPTRLRHTYSDGNEMEWSPSVPQKQYRAFKPRSPQENTNTLFGQTPVRDQPSPFWFKVPPAPITPAQRLRNPPNQPRLNISPQDVKENFFNNVTRRSSDPNNIMGGLSLKTNTYDEVEFAQPKFFPPSPTSEADEELATLFGQGFSLKEPPQMQQPQGFQLRHFCSATILLFGLLFWLYSLNNPSENSRNVTLGVMGLCVLIAARTILDNTTWAKASKQPPIPHAVASLLGGLELAGAVYGVKEILFGRSDYLNLKGRSGAKRGTMTVGHAISKRSTRTFVEEHHIMESGNGGQIMRESQIGSYSEEKIMTDSKRNSWSSTKNIDLGRGSVSDIGIDTYGLFPNTVEGIENEVPKSLQTIKSKAKEEGKPLNFGIVVPGSIYRSSFPQTEDFQYLQSLGLKTIVSLVNKDFPPEFKAFIKGQGICHRIIDMAGTKKVEISETIMNSIMEIVLDKENYPLLVHCNHGKHRTGCAVAVIRHAYGWNVNDIVEEYHGYAEPKVRECDVRYIREYQVSTLRAIIAKVEHTQDSHPILFNPRIIRILFMVLIVFGVWFTTFRCFPLFLLNLG